MLFSTDFVGAKYCPQQLYTLFIFSIFILNILSYNTLNSNLAKKTITLLTRTNSVTGKTTDIDISMYDSILLTLNVGSITFASVEANISELALISANTIFANGSDGVNNYQGKAMLNISTKKLISIISGQNNCMTSVFGIKY